MLLYFIPNNKEKAMKKYFAKYLPVEGEIKIGDVIKDSLGYITITSEEGVRVYTEANKQRYKLFLCSRDKKPMDIVTFESGKRTQIEKWDEDYNQWVFNGKSRVSDEDCFKVIGEISSDATWVKEGDEFDEKDLLLVEYPEGLDQKDFWVEWDWKNINGLLENVKLGSSVLVEVIKQ